MKESISKISTALLLMAVSIGANAATKTTTQTTASLAPSCQFSASDVVFGVYNPFANDHLQTTQNISYKCNKGVAFSMWTYASNTIVLGGYGAATAMTSPETADKLYYQVLEPQVNSTYWNEDMNTNGESYKGTGNGTVQNLSFQYRILKSQAVQPANYTATQTITFNF